MTLAELLEAATPGPWEPVIERGDEWWFGHGNQARIRGAEQPEWDSLAVLGCDDEEETADARLIALAPELARLVLDMGEEIARVQKHGSDSMNGHFRRKALLARLDGIANSNLTGPARSNSTSQMSSTTATKPLDGIADKDETT